MTFKHKKILVVDDDPIQTALLERQLGKEGYHVLSTNEAADGLQMAMEGEIDLIVLDVMMPVINGYNFCKILKSEKSRWELPVIFLTSRDKEDDVAIGHQMGASAYLTKPVDINMLVDKIEELLSD